MSESPQPLSLPAAKSRALVALNRAFLSAVRSWSLYPAEHPTVRASLDRFRDAIAEAHEEQVASAITVTPTSLLIRGVPAPNDPIIQESAALLHAQGILELGFDPVVPAEAPARLLAVLARPAASLHEEGGVAEVWDREGHPAIRIEAVDYRKVLEDREADKPRRDDVWRAIVTALTAERRPLDEREQQRLLEVAEDPAALAALAEDLIATQRTPDGSPMVTTQAATVLATFRHLVSIASVVAPERLPNILNNLATALLDIDPHLSLEVLSLDGERAGNGTSQLAGVLNEEGVAQLLATVLALEGQASTRVARVFELLVPDAGRRRHVLEQARTLAKPRYNGPRDFDAIWNSIEELLLSYNDQAFVGSQYGAILDGGGAAGTAGGSAGAPRIAELPEWLASVSEENLRQLSIVLLADLLRLEPHADRAVSVLNHLADLADDLLVAGTYNDAAQVLDVIREGAGRGELATPCSQALERLGEASGVYEAAATIADLSDTDWLALLRCYTAIGAPCLGVLTDVLKDDRNRLAADRAGEVFVAIGEPAVASLTDVLDGCSIAARGRLAVLLGRIGSSTAVPALQNLLRSRDARLIQSAVSALATIEDAAADRAIQLALGAPDTATRELVVNALVAVSDRRVVPMLVRVIGDSQPLNADYQAVLNALDALARLRDGRAVQAVTRVMFARRSLLRRCFSRRKVRTLTRAAVRALVEIGDAAALQALNRAGSNGDRFLRGIVRDVQVRPIEGAA